mmetsp:Transcript_1893/g.4473  ORF Transcript_1893/g.4473 Transcript_1893/m.4473 type:complete len:214 (-) Transcript_1893:379-1020(-)
MAAMAALSRLISCILSCFALVATSALLMASCTFWSFSLRKPSNRSASSSSMRSLFFSASSRCTARSSSFRISARFVSRLIWTRKISRFFCMKSAMTSFSFRRWSEGIACCAAVSPFGGSARRPSATLRGALDALRLEKVVLSATDMCRSRSRSSALRCFSTSRIRKTSSSGGSTKGLLPNRWLRSEVCELSGWGTASTGSAWPWMLGRRLFNL